MEGYIKLYRSSLKDPLYMQEVFTKWQAWCDIILMAYHSPSVFFIRGVKVDAQRGCVYLSASELGKRWRWSRGKVDRFLRCLEKDGRIEVISSNVVNRICVLNYEKFQSVEDYGESKCSEKIITSVPNTSMREEAFQQILSHIHHLETKLAPEEKQEEKKQKRKKEINPLITNGREIFEKRYSDMYGDKYYWQAKDAAAMDALTKKIIFSRKQKGMSVETEEVLDALRIFLENICDDWILKNFSVSNINSKYNEIVSQIRTKRNGTNIITNKGKEQRAQGAANLIARLEEKERNNVSPLR